MRANSINHWWNTPYQHSRDKLLLQRSYFSYTMFPLDAKMGIDDFSEPTLEVTSGP